MGRKASWLQRVAYIRLPEYSLSALHIHVDTFLEEVANP